MIHSVVFIHHLESACPVKAAPEQQNIQESQHIPSKELDEAYAFLGQKGDDHTLSLTGLQLSPFAPLSPERSSHWAFSGNAIDESKAIVLRSILRKDQSLKSLNLSCFVLFQELESTCQCDHFCSTGNQLTKGVTLILSDILKDNRSITALDLSSLLTFIPMMQQRRNDNGTVTDNNLGDFGAILLSDGLQSNSVLTTLNLSSLSPSSVINMF